MTVLGRCFKILSEADRPIPSKELAKMIGHHQTRGSIESGLFKYYPDYVRKVKYDCGDNCKTAWVFVKFPEHMIHNEPLKKRNYEMGVHRCFIALERSNLPLTSGQLAEIMGYPKNKPNVTSVLRNYVKLGYIKKVPYRWGKCGKVGYVFVKMPKRFQ